MGCGDHLSKRIGIIGSRRRASEEDGMWVEQAFLSVYESGDWIISGGCPMGGDRFAERIAKGCQVPILILYARWNAEGRSAGFNRNGTIAENSDILIACVSEDRTGGTEDTIRKFKKAGHSDSDIILV